MPQSNSGYSMFGAIAMLVVGLVIFVPSGLCTGLFALGPIIESILHPSRSQGAFSIVPIALFIGGPFVAGGFLLIWMGIKRIREIRQDSKPE